MAFAFLVQGGLGLDLLLSKLTKEFYAGGVLQDTSVTTEADAFPSGELGAQVELFPGKSAGLFLAVGSGWAFDADRDDWFNGEWFGGGLRLSVVGNNLLGIGGAFKPSEPSYPLFWAEFDLAGRKLWGTLSPFLTVAWRRSTSETKVGGSFQYTLTSSVTSDISASLGIRARLGSGF